MRVAQSLDDRPSNGASARPRKSTCCGIIGAPTTPNFAGREVDWADTEPRALRRSGSVAGRGGLGGGACALCGPGDAGKHRRGIAVEDLLAGFVPDLCVS